MREYNIYIGLTSKAGHPLNHKRTESTIVNNLTSQGIDSFSISKIKGYWKSTSEETLKIIIINIEEKDIKKKLSELCKFWKNEFMQESILLSSHKIEANLI